MNDLLHFINITELKEDKATHKFVKVDIEREVPTRQVQLLKLPAACVKFSFYDRLRQDKSDKDSNLPNGNVYDMKINESPVYYIGREYSLDEIRDTLGEEAPLCQEMEDLLAVRAVKVHTGQFMILGAKGCQEVVLSKDQVHFAKEDRDKTITSEGAAQTRFA